MTDPLTRRSVVRGFGLAFVGGVAGFVAARRSDAAKPRPPTSAANAYGDAPTNVVHSVLTSVDRIPSGGGLVLGNVVLTRDAQDNVRGYSSTCTHQGCKVDTIADGRISCPCHGSAFNASTGAVVSGPATRPLPPVAVEVRDGNVYMS